ncbi:MAG: FMN-binding protein [Actinobacteria bacterium]|nr:MAG: FMN-binding protein [Actinomycetota bacterium]
MRLILSVVVTCAVAAAGLSVTYGATKDLIAEQERLAVEKALAEVMGDAAVGATFEQADQALLDRAVAAAGETPVYAVYAAKSASGETVGWGLKVGPRGYGGPITMVVGLDSSGLVTGVTVVLHNETPGLGTKAIGEPEYLAKFVGVDGKDIEKSAKKVDTITGATKSSRGVRKGVIAAGHVYADVLSKEGGAQ